ncbi:unnamed protein product [Chrysoparadoxa australica]
MRVFPYLLVAAGVTLAAADTREKEHEIEQKLPPGVTLNIDPMVADTLPHIATKKGVPKIEPAALKKVEGMEAFDAKKQLQGMFPNMIVAVVPEGSMMTMDFNPKRLRCMLGKDGKVMKVTQG